VPVPNGAWLKNGRCLDGVDILVGLSCPSTGGCGGGGGGLCKRRRDRPCCSALII